MPEVLQLGVLPCQQVGCATRSPPTGEPHLCTSLHGLRLVQVGVEEILGLLGRNSCYGISPGPLNNLG